MSLRWRVALLIASLVAVAVAAGSIGAQLSAGNELRDGIDTFLLERSTQATSVIEGFERVILGDRRVPVGDGDGGPRVAGGRFRDPRPFIDGAQPLGEVDAITQLVSATDEPVVLTEQPVLTVGDEVALARNSGEPVFDEVEVDGVNHRRITVALESGAAVQVARSLEEVEDALGGLRTRLWLLGISVTAVAAVAGWMLARRTTRPIEQLTSAADHVARTQDLDAPIAARGSGEVGDLAGSFNTMLGALAESRHQQRRLILDASHELRTPLTALQTNAELLATAALDDTDREAAIATIRSEVGELANLVSELVDLSTDTHTAEPVVACDLVAIAAGVAERARRLHGRDVLMTAPNELPLVGQAGLLERAVANIVDNALKFTGDDTAIELVVGADRVEVRDHGPGFAEQDLEHVFDRFYRAASSRTLPGSGLGLSIVEHVAAADGGEAFARNHPDGGAVVGLTLERHEAP